MFLFIIKTLLFSTLLIILCNRTLRIQKKTAFLFLFTIYCFAYIFSPYWSVFPSPNIAFLGIILLYLVGLAWSFYSSGDVELRFKFTDIPALFLLSLVILVINFIPLQKDIPWRGDEAFHIDKILNLSTHLTTGIFDVRSFIGKYISVNSILSIIFIFLFLVIVASSLRKSKRDKAKKIFFLVGGVVTVIIIPILSYVIFYPNRIITSNFLSSIQTVLRYPYVQKWANLAFIIPTMYRDIALYRVVPFLSALYLSWFLFESLHQRIKNRLIAVLLAFAFTSIPLVYFYSSILYLELPIAFITTICIFDIEALISSSYRDVRSRPSWYLLLLSAFLKETTFIFSLTVLCLRFLVQFKAHRNNLATVMRELTISLLVLCPSLIFLFFRTAYSTARKAEWDLFAITNVSNFTTFGMSLLTQYGFILITAVIGVIVLALKKKWIVILSLAAALIAQSAFIFLYRIGDINYVGYSRFNLFLLPVILYTAYFGVIVLSGSFQILVITILILSNIVLSPIHLDGTRLPNWGSPRVDTAEYVYPFDQAVQWLSTHGKPKHLLVFGHYYFIYVFRFYFGKYNYHPQFDDVFFSSSRFDAVTEARLLNGVFQSFADGTIDKKKMVTDTILYQSINNIKLENKVYGGGFKIAKKFSNSEESLYVFTK